MTHRSAPAAMAFLCALAAAACGIGPGDSVGDVQLTVTRDYGSEVLVQRNEEDAPESETAMRLLDRSAEISTRYGGRFVQSIDGIEGERHDGRQYDWFFYVNGVESSVGASDYGLHGGDRVWWDYRDWAAAMRVPAVVGAYPEPFLHGYEGTGHPLRVRCLGGGPACGLVGMRLRAATGSEGKSSAAPLRVLVGPWERLRNDDAAALIERGPAYSGVFADFVKSGGSWRLQNLDVEGRTAGRARDAGLVAATRRGDDPPTWVVTGSDAGDTLAAARLLDPSDLRDRYAVSSDGGQSTALPVR